MRARHSGACNVHPFVASPPHLCPIDIVAHDKEAPPNARTPSDLHTEKNDFRDVCC